MYRYKTSIVTLKSTEVTRGHGKWHYSVDRTYDFLLMFNNIYLYLSILHLSSSTLRNAACGRQKDERTQ